MELHKLTRVYIDKPLVDSQSIIISGDLKIYLSNIMRLKNGHKLRVFNENNGEFLAEITLVENKFIEIRVIHQITPGFKTPELTLYFPIIRPERLRFLIEKAVELGVTNFIPVITEYTNKADVKFDKLENYIGDALEQSERFTKPTIYPAINLLDIKGASSIMVAIERADDKLTKAKPSEFSAFLVGPEGGFSENEKTFLLKNQIFIPISLGKATLRSETAVVSLLSLHNFTG